VGNGTAGLTFCPKPIHQQTDGAFLNTKHSLFLQKSQVTAATIPLDIQPEELRAEWDMMIKYFGLDVYMCPTGEDEDDEWLGSTVVL